LLAVFPQVNWQLFVIPVSGLKTIWSLSWTWRIQVEVYLHNVLIMEGIWTPVCWWGWCQLMRTPNALRPYAESREQCSSSTYFCDTSHDYLVISFISQAPLLFPLLWLPEEVLALLFSSSSWEWRFLYSYERYFLSCGVACSTLTSSLSHEFDKWGDLCVEEERIRSWQQGSTNSLKVSLHESVYLL
jgi:hypothetical protein